VKFLNRVLRALKKDYLVCEKCHWYYFNPKSQACHIYKENIDARIIIGEKRCNFYNKETIVGYLQGFINIIENHI